MRYSLALHTAPDDAQTVSDEQIQQFQRRYGEYADALASAGVLVAAEILHDSECTTAVTRREGQRQVTPHTTLDPNQAATAMFLIDVDHFDVAMEWAERCPGIEYGTIEIRPCAVSYHDGKWHR